MFNFKGKFFKSKKRVITSVIALTMGVALGYPSGVDAKEHNTYIRKNNEIEVKLESVNKSLSEKNESIKLLGEEKTKLLAKKEEKRLAKEEAERLERERVAKEEEERLERERKVREEQERIERERQESQSFASSDESSNSGSTSSNSSNSNSGGSSSNSSNNQAAEPIGQMVWKTRTGKRYHRISKCGNTKSATQVTLSSAKAAGLTACGNCY